MSWYRLPHLLTRFALFFAIVVSSVGSVQAEDPLGFVPGSWTMVVLPDTQRYTSPTTDPGLQTFSDMTQWIVDNKGDCNIQFVLHEGDITADNTAATWQVASDAMTILETAGVPYSMTTGNHDHDQYTPDHQHSPSRDTLLNNYFPTSRYEAMSTFGGTFELGKTENNYHLFSAGGTDYITVALEWGPRDEALAWADSVLTEYSDRTAMIMTHAYTYSDGTRYDWATKGTSQSYNPHCASYAFSAPHNGTENINDGQEIWDKLVSNHANASMVFSGHVAWAGARQTSVGKHGQVVSELLAAYHDPPQGWLRLLEFNPDGETVQVKTYSPTLDQYMTDDDNQFVIKMGVIADPVVPIGSILVSTRSSAAGIVALDLDGNVVGGFVPAGAYDVTSVQQISPNGDILVAHQPTGGDRVDRYSINGSYLGSVSGTVDGKYTATLAINSPVDDSTLAFVQHNKGAISSIDLEANEVVNTYTWGFDTGMRGSVVGPDGDLYFAIQSDGIYKLNESLSTLTRVVNDSTQNSFNNLAFGPDGMLYLTTNLNNGVIRYDPSLPDGSPDTSAEIFVFAGSGGLDLATGLMFHPTTGNLLVGSYNTDQILEYDGITGNYLGVFANVDEVWGFSIAPAVTAPEPSTLILLLTATVFLLLQRK